MQWNISESLNTTPSYPSVQFQPTLGATVQIVGPSDFLGAQFIVQVSYDEGANYTPLQGILIDRPCSFAIPFGPDEARFVCVQGPSGALQAPVANISLRK